METLTVDKTQQKTMQQPILVPPGGGEKLNIAGSPISHKVKSKDTNGVFSVMEFVTPPGKGVALHVHEREDELVYLLEGEIEVTLGDQKMKAVSGLSLASQRRQCLEWQTGRDHGCNHRSHRHRACAKSSSADSRGEKFYESS